MTRDYSILSGETITVRRTNWKTPAFIYVLLVFGVSFPLAWMFLPGMKNLPVFFGVIVILFTLLNLRVWGLLTTVTIGPEGIEFRSPLKSRLFKWNAIQTTGIYVVSRNRKEPLSPQRYEEKFYLRLKYIWLSTYPHSEPGMFRVNNEFYGDFEYNAEAWELMKKYQSANRTDQPNGTIPGTITGHSTF